MPALVKTVTETETGMITPGDVVYLYPDKTVFLYEFMLKNGSTLFRFYYRLNGVVIKPGISDDTVFIQFDDTNRIFIRIRA